MCYCISVQAIEILRKKFFVYHDMQYNDMQCNDMLVDYFVNDIIWY